MCTKERKPHKHAEIIKAWADGAIIQFKTYGGEWLDVPNNKPEWCTRTEYRVKPSPLKTSGYRRYVYNWFGTSPRVYTLSKDEGTTVSTVERQAHFVKWIDDEWQYHEVEVK